jgi:chaperonin cofactor prefoldin
MTGETSEILSDVVEDNEIFRVSPKIQIKMQNRHNLMQNIQNIGQIIQNLEMLINRSCMILKSMETHKDTPHYWNMGEFTIPVSDPEEAIGFLNAGLDMHEKDLAKHIAQVKSMQLQHDGLTKEIDLMMELEKGKYEAGKTQKDKIKRGRRR